VSSHFTRKFQYVLTNLARAVGAFLPAHLIGRALLDHAPEGNNGAGLIDHAQSNPIVITKIVFAQIAVQVLFITVLVQVASHTRARLATTRSVNSDRCSLPLSMQ
jgi:hypothetical protein